MRNVIMLCLETDDFIWKFKIDLNLLFSKSQIFKFEYRSNSTIIFKVVKVENLKINTQKLSTFFIKCYKNFIYSI